ncbi:unnamed protein product [Calicophoron daubneyi]|uniref:Uncharacterized protein n=1 Tax=Calicophoron daubneyi TaxID=300641 RepID=A0AAV2TA39_CALDB
MDGFDVSGEFEEMVCSRDYGSFDEFEEALSNFCLSTSTSYVRRRVETIANDHRLQGVLPSCLKYVNATFKCVHRDRRYKANVRGPRYANYKCPSQFKIYCEGCRLKVRQEGKVMLHNHSRTEDQPWVYTKNRIGLGRAAMEEVQGLLRCYKTSRAIREYVRERFHRTLTAADVAHIRARVAKKHSVGGDSVLNGSSPSEDESVAIPHGELTENSKASETQPVGVLTSEVNSQDSRLTRSRRLASEIVEVLDSLEFGEFDRQCNNLRTWIDILTDQGCADVIFRKGSESVSTSTEQFNHANVFKVQMSAEKKVVITTDYNKDLHRAKKVSALTLIYYFMQRKEQ